MSLNGKIIVIEGTDGSGKQTQAEILMQRLQESGYKVYSTSFPRYESDSSAAVRMYLNGKIGDTPETVSAKAASAFYAVDRYITYKREIEEIFKKKDSVIVFDRWVSSNIIHQGVKLISNITDENEREKELKDFIKWLSNLEHGDLELPKADVTFYLHVPVEYTIKLRENRLNKSNGQSEQDIHESNTEYLINATKTGLLAAKMLGWKVIECIKDDQMRSREDIAEEIWQTLN